MTKTIPKTRRKARMPQDPKVYLEIIVSMKGFDPNVAPDTEFDPWGLDKTYPPSASELTGTLLGVIAPPLEVEDAQVAPPPADADPGGSGPAVPGEPEDSDQVGD